VFEGAEKVLRCREGAEVLGAAFSPLQLPILFKYRKENPPLHQTARIEDSSGNFWITLCK
jgi:hypothetical protein